MTRVSTYSLRYIGKNSYTHTHTHVHVHTCRRLDDVATYSNQCHKLGLLRSLVIFIKSKERDIVELGHGSPTPLRPLLLRSSFVEEFRTATLLQLFFSIRSPMRGFSSSSKNEVPEARSLRACPPAACQLRNRDLTVVTCSVSTIVRRSKWGVQSGCDHGLHDGRTGG